MVKIMSGRRCKDTLPTCFMPRARKESPIAANKVTPASTRYLRRVTRSFPRTLPTTEKSGLGGFRHGRRLGFVPLLLHPLVPRRSQFEETFGFLVQTLALDVAEYRLPENAVNRFRPEVVFVVE